MTIIDKNTKRINEYGKDVNTARQSVKHTRAQLQQQLDMSYEKKAELARNLSFDED